MLPIPQNPPTPQMLPIPQNPPMPQMLPIPQNPLMPTMPSIPDKSTIPPTISEQIPSKPPMPFMPYPSAIATNISETMKQYISPNLRPTTDSYDGLDKNIDVRFDKRTDSEIISENKSNSQLEDPNINGNVMQVGGNNMNIQSGNTNDSNGTSIQSGIVQIGPGMNTNIKGDIPFTMPEFVMPTFVMPEMPEMPQMPSIPGMSGFKMPKFEMPKFEMPKFEMPSKLNEESEETDSKTPLDDSKIPDSMEILSQIKNDEINSTHAILSDALKSTTPATTTETKQIKRVIEITTFSPTTIKFKELNDDVLTISLDNNSLENITEIDLVTTMESMTEISTLREDNSLNDDDNVIEGTTELFPSRIDPNVIRTLAG